jgi:hypothetical protein
MMEIEKEIVSKTSLQVIKWFGSTGNFLLETTKGARSMRIVRSQLAEVFPKGFAVLTPSSLESGLDVVSSWRKPRKEDRVRWSPGLVFLMHRDRGKAVRPRSTHRVRLRLVSGRLVAAYKRDCLNPDNRTLSTERLGGWGGVARDVQLSLGGTWTARSLSPILALWEEHENIP